MRDIVDERILSYVYSLDTDLDGVLGEIKKEAISDHVPIIRQDTESLLQVLISMKKPMRILEVGTAVGFSALYMASFLPEGGTITTIENYPPRIEKAKENIKKMGKENCITLLEGDALCILPTLTDTYDFIFMDAAKGQYINFLPEILRLLNVGGMLVSDNCLQEGDVVESRYAVTKRDRTIHTRMREYLSLLKHHDQLRTSILTVGDGMALSVKIK